MIPQSGIGTLSGCRRPIEGPLCADIVAKVFWGGERKFFEPLMRFMRGNVREHIVFIQNRSRTSAVALESDAAAENSKDQLWRDFPGRSIFDFCKNIHQKRKSAI